MERTTMKIFLRGVSVEEMKTLLTEELNLARHLSEKQARLHFGTIENQNAAMVKWWEAVSARLDVINIKLDKLEAMLREKEEVLAH